MVNILRTKLTKPTKPLNILLAAWIPVSAETEVLRHGRSTCQKGSYREQSCDSTPVQWETSCDTDTWEREGPLDWLSQLAVEDAACRAGVFSLASLEHPRTTAENQEDSKAGLRGQVA